MPLLHLLLLLLARVRVCGGLARRAAALLVIIDHDLPHALRQRLNLLLIARLDGLSSLPLLQGLHQQHVQLRSLAWLRQMSAELKHQRLGGCCKASLEEER
eukprot:CAMPEP_0206256886 /NCGR_PEP_ID=MMETSP0047_2-20121206/25028_1 /ASSEMBLY_ACC=CAM_ASM_000192 /TAXON_ID=195065 /ORGANISM="Chroomonas mesostigmatica_cf, Strain CCMP1168" /LENGTH=100 /DNA_ID=CAMNT_0053683399 /DNA_START=25 /DNA_END=323 /DNA_ORIENTATION=-